MQGPISIPGFGQSSLNTFASSTSASRPTTREGSSAPPPLSGSHLGSSVPSFLSRERKSSFSRKASLSSVRRRGSTSASASSNTVVTDNSAPPALPDYALSSAAKVLPREGKESTRSPVSPDDVLSSLSRSATLSSFMAPPSHRSGILSPSAWATEADSAHKSMVELVNKRIATFDYLRKTHEGHIHWFTTYLFEKPDLARMPAYDARKLARKATNLLLLGLSIPTISDLYSSTPLEFLRCLSTLFSEFESFQQLHSDTANSLTRARLPNMFRRPGGKSRRSASVAEFGEDAQGLTAGGATAMPSFMNFAASESDLLPGEDYTYLLTPSLPFDPDFFETFSTLCDVLIDCYQRFLQLVPTSKECSAPVAEAFSKADAKIKKLIVQGVIKDFEDQSRSSVKSEVANIGKIVLGGLM